VGLTLKSQAGVTPWPMPKEVWNYVVNGQDGSDNLEIKPSKKRSEVPPTKFIFNCFSIPAEKTHILYHTVNYYNISLIMHVYISVANI
jgi:hypothetical protein